MVDEAHSLGVLGKTGRGIAEHFGVDPRDVDMLMGTLSKAMASCGGYIAGSRELLSTSSTLRPASSLAAACRRPARPPRWLRCGSCRPSPSASNDFKANSRLFLSAGEGAGPQYRHERRHARSCRSSPATRCTRADALAAMFERGINVQPILYPAVEEEKARLRFFITSPHTEEQIRHTVEMLTEEIAKIDPRHLKAAAQIGVGDVRSL